MKNLKRYLVIKNSQYYPSAGTGDWDGPYKTLSEARRESREWDARGGGNHSYIEDLFAWIGMNEREEELDDE
jgi:hypothetical protein